ncbi:hypothetical protein C0J52_06995 [Blattella germanica]|nr:hypothetical protein C0J52_06995 [Blattella germanica]
MLHQKIEHRKILIQMTVRELFPPNSKLSQHPTVLRILTRWLLPSCSTVKNKFKFIKGNKRLTPTHDS